MSEASSSATTGLDPVILLDSPDNNCFGCSPHNARGLRLAWVRKPDGSVEGHYTAAAHLEGAPGVIHGGIQAALLDETIGVGIHQGLPEPDQIFIVTADFDIRYRRPAPCGQQLVLRGRLTRRDGRNYYGEGEITQRDGTLLTSATARWREIPAPAAS